MNTTNNGNGAESTEDTTNNDNWAENAKDTTNDGDAAESTEDTTNNDNWAENAKDTTNDGDAAENAKDTTNDGDAAENAEDTTIEGDAEPGRGTNADPALERAFSEPGLRPLPGGVVALLRDLGAPPRLGAHLRAVHDVAVELLDRLGESVDVDRDAVLFGAATHDVGKVRFPGELTGPGAEHEPVGEALLRARGFEPRLARFAALHGRWERGDATIEELLVTLADKVWKGRREAGLEQKVAEMVAADTGEAVWAVYMRLDDILTAIAGGADDRLAFQARFPVGAAASAISRDEIMI